MKKLLAVLMVAMMAMLAVACAKKDANEPGEVISTDAPTKGAEEKGEMVGMANPMVETDAKGVMDKTGLEFKIPEGASDVQYFVINNELAEARFKLDGVEYTARMQPTGEFTDISGYYYEWDSQEDAKVGGLDAKMMRKNGDPTIDVILWFDAVPGVMYSLSAQAKDLDGFDISAVAEQMYVPMQGNA